MMNVQDIQDVLCIVKNRVASIYHTGIGAATESTATSVIVSGKPKLEGHLRHVSNISGKRGCQTYQFSP